MTRGDVLHAIGLLLCAGSNPADRFRLAEAFKLSREELIYVDYCAAANEPDKRSYEALRVWLRSNVETHGTKLRQVLAGCSAFLAARGQTPAVIFDVGAGHAAWSGLLAEVWPDAQVFAVDRFKIEGLGSHSLVEDAVEFIEGFHEDEPTLLFMSEWVHCKQRNLDALACPKIAGCSKLVVELQPDEHAIGERLRQTGGRLVTPHDVLAAHGPVGDAAVTFHEATFRYWSMTMTPVLA